MKILERGQIPNEQLYEIRCTKCRTLFQFQQQEAKYHSDQRDGDYLMIDCPVCKEPASTAVRRVRPTPM